MKKVYHFRFITFDVVTSDLARQVYPGVEGLMMGARISIVNFMHITCDCYISDLELSEDDKYAAAYTNNYQIIILNTLISEFIIVENPFKHPQISGDI